MTTNPLNQPKEIKPISARDLLDAIQVTNARIDNLTQALARLPRSSTESPLVWFRSYEDRSTGLKECVTARASDLAALQTLRDQLGAILPAARPGPAAPPDPTQHGNYQEFADAERTIGGPPQDEPPTDGTGNNGVCPKCNSAVWDNRHDPSRNPRAPLMKCKNQDCDWRLWPARKNRKERR